MIATAPFGRTGHHFPFEIGLAAVQFHSDEEPAVRRQFRGAGRRLS